MKKISKKGWIGRRSIVTVLRVDSAKMIYISGVFATKGKKSEWGTDQWPPERVTVTVEVED